MLDITFSNIILWYILVDFTLDFHTISIGVNIVDISDDNSVFQTLNISYVNIYYPWGIFLLFLFII